MTLPDDIYLDGGPGVNEGLLLCLKEEFMREIHVLAKPQFTVAFGAAMLLLKGMK